MSTEDTIPQGGRDDARGDTTRQDAPARPEPREEQHRDPRVITDADRAANPIGVAKREREQRERDEAGRFAKGTDQQRQAKPDGKDGGDKPTDQNQQERQAQGQTQDQQGDRRAPPPPPGVQGERDRRQAAEREVERLSREVAEMRGMMMARPMASPPPAQQQSEAPPEFWTDPNAAMEHRVRQAMSPVERQFQEHRLGVSRTIAMATHGPEKVQAAVQALAQLRQNNPAEFARLERDASQSADPVGDVVRWHIQSSALQRYGADPEAYVRQEVERRIAEMRSQQQQAQQIEDEHRQQFQPSPVPRQPVQHQQLPTAFAAQRGGGPRGGEAWGGPRPLSEITRRG